MIKYSFTCLSRLGLVSSMVIYGSILLFYFNKEPIFATGYNHTNETIDRELLNCNDVYHGELKPLVLITVLIPCISTFFLLLIYSLIYINSPKSDLIKLSDILWSFFIYTPLLSPIFLYFYSRIYFSLLKCFNLATSFNLAILKNSLSAILHEIALSSIVNCLLTVLIACTILIVFIYFVIIPMVAYIFNFIYKCLSKKTNKTYDLVDKTLNL